MLWRKVNNIECGTMTEQPTLARWECISLSFRNYLQKRTGFKRLYQATCSACKKDRNRNKIASNHLSLEEEEVTITMVHFTSAHCDSFWDIYYDMLKKPNDITKYSGHVSQHMLITHCCIHKDLKKLRENHHQEEAFFTFMSRSSQHAGKH